MNLARLLLVINTNLSPLLHHFRDTGIAFDRCKITIFGYPSAFNSADGGVPWDDFRKIFRGCQRMAKVPIYVETLPKLSTG